MNSKFYCCRLKITKHERTKIFFSLECCRDIYIYIVLKAFCLSMAHFDLALSDRFKKLKMQQQAILEIKTDYISSNLLNNFLHFLRKAFALASILLFLMYILDNKVIFSICVITFVTLLDFGLYTNLLSKTNSTFVHLFFSSFTVWN